MKKMRKVIIGVGVMCIVGAGAVVYATGESPARLVYRAQPADTMQGFTTTMCAEMQVYSTVKLRDIRNDQDYWVRKMPDNHCWMIDNMKLSGVTLTPADSDIASGSFIIPANPMNKSADHGNGTCVGGTASATGTSLTCDGTSTQSSVNNNYIAYSDPAGVDNTYADNCMGLNGIAKDSLTGCGYLYNWYTATAGKGIYDVASGDVGDSICPAGWNLPSAGTGSSNAANQFAVLNGAMNDNGAPSTTNNATTRQNWRYNGPFQGSLSGYYTTSFNYQGSYGYYWSASAYSATDARYLYFYFYVYPGNVNGTKSYGGAVRCLL